MVASSVKAAIFAIVIPSWLVEIVICSWLVDSLLISPFRVPRWLQQPPMLVNSPFTTPSDLGNPCWGESGNRGTCVTGGTGGK